MKNYLLSSIVVAGSLLVATQAYAASGKDVYEASCVACHASGAAGAPKLEDKAAWAPASKPALPPCTQPHSKARAPCLPKVAMLRFPMQMSLQLWTS